MQESDSQMLEYNLTVCNRSVSRRNCSHSDYLKCLPLWIWRLLESVLLFRLVRGVTWLRRCWREPLTFSETPSWGLTCTQWDWCFGSWCPAAQRQTVSQTVQECYFANWWKVILLVLANKGFVYILSVELSNQGQRFNVRYIYSLFWWLFLMFPLYWRVVSPQVQLASTCCRLRMK